MPDPEARAITALREQLQALARDVAVLRQQPVDASLPEGMSAREVDAAFRSIRESAAEGNGAADVEEGAGI